MFVPVPGLFAPAQIPENVPTPVTQDPQSEADEPSYAEIHPPASGEGAEERPWKGGLLIGGLALAAIGGVSLIRKNRSPDPHIGPLTVPVSVLLLLAGLVLLALGLWL